jgi:predicted ribonuclease YlaK
LLDEVQELDEAQLLTFLSHLDKLKGVVLAGNEEVIDVSTPAIV